MMARFGVPTALFSLKCFVGAMLAYYIALRLGMSRPFWAVMTAYIVANPMAGAALSKAMFRIIGTIVGAGVALVAVPLLVNSPELFSLFSALWLALCVYISQLDRTPRAYVFLLAGYTACIIGFTTVTTPELVFDIATMRVQEIFLGIVSGSLIHGLFPTQTIVSTLLFRMENMLKDAERWSIDAMRPLSSASRSPVRYRLAQDIADLHQLSVHLPYDTNRLRPRIEAIRAVQNQLAVVLPLTTAVDDHLRLLRQASALPEESEELIDDICDWLKRLSATGQLNHKEANLLVSRCEAQAAALPSNQNFHTLLLESVLGRLALLVETHRNCRRIDAQIRHPSRRSLHPVTKRLIAQAKPHTLHKDHWMASRAALSAFLTIIISCALWILTGWQDGWSAAMMAGICCALFGSSEQAVPLIRNMFIGSMVGLVAAFIYNFGIFPATTDFVTLVLVLAPLLLVMGGLMAKPATTVFGVGATISFHGALVLGEHYVGDLQMFLNNGLATLVGVGLCSLCVSFVHSVALSDHAHRLMRANWRDLSRHRARTQRFAPDAESLSSRMLDRLALIPTHLGATNPKQDEILSIAIRDLQIAAALKEIAAFQASKSAVDRMSYDMITSSVHNYYQSRLLGQTEDKVPEFLAELDAALANPMLVNITRRQRKIKMALMALRRAFFPQSTQLAVAQ